MNLLFFLLYTGFHLLHSFFYLIISRIKKFKEKQLKWSKFIVICVYNFLKFISESRAFLRPNRPYPSNFNSSSYGLICYEHSLITFRVIFLSHQSFKSNLNWSLLIVSNCENVLYLLELVRLLSNRARLAIVTGLYFKRFSYI